MARNKTPKKPASKRVEPATVNDHLTLDPSFTCRFIRGTGRRVIAISSRGGARLGYAWNGTAVFCSDDEGEHWRQLAQPPTNDPLEDIAADDPLRSWHETQTYLRGSGAGIHDVAFGHNRWVGLTEDSRLVLSLDQGHSWSPFAEEARIALRPPHPTLGRQPLRGVATQGDALYVCGIDRVGRLRSNGTLERVWTIPKEPSTAVKKKRPTPRQVRRDEMGLNAREMLHSVEVSGEPPIAVGGGLFFLPEDSNELQRFGPHKLGTGHVIRLADGMLVGGGGLTFVPFDASPAQRFVLNEGPQEKLNTLPADLPHWVKTIAAVQQVLIRGVARSPWEEHEWIIADNFGIHRVSAQGKRSIWKATHLVHGLVTVGNSVFAGFCRDATDEAVGLVIRDGGSNSSKVALPSVEADSLVPR